MQDLDQNVITSKIYELEGNNKIHAQRKDPYGLIHLHMDKGQLPESLEGAYTSYDEVEKKVLVYLNARKKTLKEAVEK